MSLRWSLAAFFAVLSASFAATPAIAAPGDLAVTCASKRLQRGELSRELRYCVHRTEGSRNRDILYFLHGLGQDERDWIAKPKYGALRREWASRGLEAPVVVTLSLGSVWLLAPKSDRPLSGLYELMLERVFPFIESTAVPEFSGRRILVGMSMGGLNAAELYLHRPELFARMALLCPATPSFPVYPSGDRVEDFWAFHRELFEYSRRNSADPLLIELLVHEARLFFSPSDWERWAPIALAERRLRPGFPPLYVSAVESDRYGLAESDRRLYEVAVGRGLDARWEIVRGAHCDVDVRRLAGFLMGD